MKTTCCDVCKCIIKAEDASARRRVTFQVHDKDMTLPKHKRRIDLCNDCYRRLMKTCCDNINIPFTVGEAIDVLFSHNEIVALWRLENDGITKKLIWRGMAHQISNLYYTSRIDRVFGTVPESVDKGDTINLLISGGYWK